MIITMLRERFGYELVSGGVGGEYSVADMATYVPQEKRFRQTDYEGTFGVNQLILEMAMKLADEYVPAIEGVNRIEAHIKGIWERLPEDHPEKDTWDWRGQRKQIVKSYLGHIEKHYRERPRLIDALPDKLKNKWYEILERGGEPELFKGAGRPDPEWGPWRVRDTGPAEEIPTVGLGAEKKAKGPFILRPRGLIDPLRISRRKFLGGGEFYQRRTVSATFAPGDYGKTTLGVTEAVSMLTGRDLLGEQPDEKLRVWIHNGEDTQDEIDRKLAAISQHYGIPLEEIAEIFITTHADIPLRVASGYGEVNLDMPLIKCIHEQIGDNKIDVAMFDPLITLHGVPEGDNSKMDQVVRVFTGIADSQNCAIGLHHHMRKGPAGEEYEFSVDDGRGASAIKDAVRAARVLNRMKEKQAQELGIPLHERAGYIRIDRAKGNNSPTRESRWVTFANVELPQGDAVGVLVPWKPPTQDTPEGVELQRRAEGVFLGILFRFNSEGRRASDRKGMNYAPKIFSKEKEARAARVGIGILEKAMRRLLDMGRVEIVDIGVGGRLIHELRVVDHSNGPEF